VKHDYWRIKSINRCGLVILLTTLGACTSEVHSIADYQQARGIFWQSVYPYKGETLYCRERFDSDYRKGINVEHVFPMSWVTKALACGTRQQCRARSAEFNRIEADLHNLYPARSEINEARGALAFGNINGEQRRFGKACDFEVDERARVAEPTLVARGEVARAMFYMAHRYHDQGLKIFARQGRLLQQWHRADPPSKHERQRNATIESLQGNRNAFIDNPDLLDRLIEQGSFF